MGVRPFYGEGPHSLLRAGSQAERRKTISCKPNRLNHSLILWCTYNSQMRPRIAQYNLHEYAGTRHSKNGGSIPGKKEVFSRASKPALMPTKLPYQGVPSTLQRV